MTNARPSSKPVTINRETMKMSEQEWQRFNLDTRFLHEQHPQIIKSRASWGPGFWMTLFVYGMEYPDIPTEEQRKQAQAVMQASVPSLLTCGICRHHFFEEAKSVWPHTRTRAELLRWLVEVHNRVNAREGKPPMAFEDVIRSYTRLTDAQRAAVRVLSGGGVPNALGLLPQDPADARRAVLLCVIVGVLALLLGAGLAFGFLRVSGRLAHAPAARGAPRAFRPIRIR